NPRAGTQVAVDSDDGVLKPIARSLDDKGRAYFGSTGGKGREYMAEPGTHHSAFAARACRIPSSMNCSRSATGRQSSECLVCMQSKGEADARVTRSRWLGNG